MASGYQAGPQYQGAFSSSRGLLSESIAREENSELWELRRKQPPWERGMELEMKDEGESRGEEGWGRCGRAS